MILDRQVVIVNRPSDKEIINKIRDAISAIEKGERAIPVSKHFSSDQDDLGIEDTKDLWPLLVILLKEIEAIGPLSCYVGGRPPEKSYEVELEGKELWPYSWKSVSMDKMMYIKFCLVGGYYFYVGCHESKPKGAAK
jgi:hypothetical protein